MSQTPASNPVKSDVASATPSKPSDPELAILQVLWRKGPSTMRDIQGEVSSLVAPTSVGKHLRVMTGKGLVQQERSIYAWRYQACYSEDQIQQQLVSALTDKAFGGSKSKLVMHVLAAGETTPEDITALKRLLEQEQKKT